jgi:MoaA/NifB/PqqE/SkfB family radical SAM enzyme
VDDVLDEALKIGTVTTVYFEGGEPTLYYPLLLESIRRAHQKGFKVGMVSNAYGALAEEDAHLLLDPLVEAGLSELAVSNDEFHFGAESDNPASIAERVGLELNLISYAICIDPPEILANPDPEQKGQSLIGGGAKFRGRAADKLTSGLPTRPWEELLECPYEDLLNPSRVHVDSYGNIHICQGISIGNLWDKPLSEIMASYSAEDHPICGPLIRKGPAGLIQELGLTPADQYVDECQACFKSRRNMLDKYPEILVPRQVYGE